MSPPWLKWWLRGIQLLAQETQLTEGTGSAPEQLDCGAHTSRCLHGFWGSVCIRGGAVEAKHAELCSPSCCTTWGAC